MPAPTGKGTLRGRARFGVTLLPSTSGKQGVMAASASILCATDFSAPARDAAHRAAHVAHETAAALTLMHVVPGGALEELRRRFGAGHASEQHMHDDVRRRLEQLSLEVSAAWHVRARTMHAVGSVVDEIIFEAGALPADVVVLGARGAGNLRRLFLGTTSERLLRRTTRQHVLVVRQPPEVPYRSALVGVDFSPSSVRVLEAARQVAPLAQLVLLHAIESALPQGLVEPGADPAGSNRHRDEVRAEAARRLQQLAAAAGLAEHAWQGCIVEGRASERILGHLPQCDLVVLGKHGRTLTEDLLLGSVTQHVLAEGGTDVLIAPASAA